MKNYTEIDNLFGVPVAVTFEGKVNNMPITLFIVGSLVLFVVIVGIEAIVHRLKEPNTKEQKK